jgi:hypothetical protein
VLKLIAAVVIFSVAAVAASDVRVRFDHNDNSVASSAFKFKNVPSPAIDDAAARAKLTLVDGEIDSNSADLSALTDGRMPADEDEPGANFFFNAGTAGGRFRLDIGNPREIAQVNTYSWHPNTRGPQLYKLYAADGTEPGLNLDPGRGIDPASVGWRFIATVSTLPQQGEEGGQYGVSIGEPARSLGKYRYLLFDCYATEMNDDWGNTFYSEVDVVAAPDQ